MPNTFPPEVIAAAVASQARWDVPASVTLAQWALESRWGRAMPPGSDNPFGIKATAGQPSVSAITREVVNGRAIHLPQSFRRFGSLEDAFDAHARLLATGQAYVAARAVRHDPHAFAAALQGHYATDPHYAAELIAIIDGHDLTRFDARSSPHTPMHGSPEPDAAVSPPVRLLLSTRTTMLTNKYIQAALSAGVAIFGWAAAFDWTTVTSAKTSAGIAGAIGVVKLVLNAVSPTPGVPVQPTGGLIVTHKEV